MPSATQSLKPEGEGKPKRAMSLGNYADKVTVQAADAIKRRRGAPSIYTDEIAKEINDRIANGENLHTICNDSHMPSLSTVHNWMQKRPEFMASYGRAREAQADRFADEIIEIADTATPETANAVKVRVDARKWVAAKLRPAAYGERVEASLTAKVEYIQEHNPRQLARAVLQVLGQAKVINGEATAIEDGTDGGE